MIKVKDGKLQAELLDNKGTLSNKIIEQYDYIELKNDFAEIVDILSTNMLVHAMYQEALKYEITEELEFKIFIDENVKDYTMTYDFATNYTYFSKTNTSLITLDRKNYDRSVEMCMILLKKVKASYDKLNEVEKFIIKSLEFDNPPETERLAESLKSSYDVPVLPISVENMSERDIYSILREALYEFPVMEVKVDIPDWVACLDSKHYLKKEYIEKIRESVVEVDKLRDIEKITSHFNDSENIEKAYLSDVDTSTGEVTLTLQAPSGLFNSVIKDIINVDINSRAELLSLFQDYNEAKREYDQIKSALKMVKQTGYGVATPSLMDMKLDTPEIIKQGSRYGIKLKAVAPSIHIVCTKGKHLSLIDYVGINTIKHTRLLTV